MWSLMAGAAIKSAVITPDKEASFRIILPTHQGRKWRGQTVGGRTGNCSVSTAGMENNDAEIRITAAVPHLDANRLTVDSLSRFSLW
jgi:hypothetical protein